MAVQAVIGSPSRREFLGSLAAISLFPPLDAEKPDLILHSGNFFTVDDLQPRAQAVAISSGRFLAVGSNAEVLNLAAPNVKKIDLGGKSVLPGFIDAHCHPSAAGVDMVVTVNCDLPSIAAIQAALRERATKTPREQWVIGSKYDDMKGAEGRMLTRADLDAAVPDVPVMVMHRGGHTTFYNSAAFRAAGIDEKTPDPPGGKFDRDPATGKFTGRVADQARELVQKNAPDPTNRENRAEGIKLVSQAMARAGITSVGDAGGTPDDLGAYQDARDAGNLLFRVYCLIVQPDLEKALAAGMRTGLGDEFVRVGACKQFCDGSISERTARLSKAYEGSPDYFGLLMMSEEEQYERSKKAHLAGWQLGTHANGDVAIDQTLRVYERLQKESPRRDPRFRIEHCTMVNDHLIARMKTLGVIPTPFSSYVYYHGEKMHFYGAERLKNMFAMRSLIDAGIRPTQASDYTASPYEPMMALQSEVTRTDTKGNVWGANQRISIEEAIRVGTMNGAYPSYEEKIKGSITAGKLADLVVLGRNPSREAPSSLVTIPVERTMLGGRWSFES
jgi:predicted amidohydrolase YtcJ